MPWVLAVLALLAAAFFAGAHLAGDLHGVPHFAAVREWLSLHVTHRRELQDVVAVYEVATTGRSVQGPGTVCGALVLLGLRAWLARRRLPEGQ